jgi:hypothetical protein
MTSDIDTWQTDNPTCPWCGAQDKNWWEHRELQSDGSELTVTCGFCAKDYTILMHISYAFDTWKRQETLTEEIERAEKKLARLDERLEAVRTKGVPKHLQDMDIDAGQLARDYFQDVARTDRELQNLYRERSQLQESGQWEAIDGN